jgi:hypothetical protein
MPCIEDGITDAVQASQHVHALIQVDVNLAGVAQHDRGLRVLLKPQRRDAMPALRQFSAITDQ